MFGTQDKRRVLDSNQRTRVSISKYSVGNALPTVKPAVLFPCQGPYTYMFCFFSNHALTHIVGSTTLSEEFTSSEMNNPSE